MEGFFEIGNFGHTHRWPCGHRTVFAIVGRKWVKLLDWASGHTANISKITFQSMKPQERPAPKRRLLKHAAKYKNARNKIRYRHALRA